MRRVRAILLAVCGMSLVLGHLLRIAFPAGAYDEKNALGLLAPAGQFGGKAGVPPHYRDSSGYVAFNTYDVTPDLRGYAGPIKMMIILDPKGRIAGLRILEHRETKNYVHYMVSPEYLARFLGKPVTDPFEVERDVDAISRATVSVEAMARTIGESSRRVAAGVLGIPVITGTARGKTDPGWLWYLLLFFTAFALYLLTRKRRGLQRLRDAVLAASVLLIGLYLASPFSILQVYNLLLGRPGSSYLWYAAVISTAVSLVVAGRFYCGWLCPFGAISEFIGRMTKGQWAVPAETDDRWRKGKYAVLGLTSAAVFISGRTDYGNVETYVTLFSRSGHILAWALVAVCLLANLRIRRFWCRYLCPVGGLTGALSMKAPGYPSRPDCPVGNRPHPLISECIRCNRCYQLPKDLPLG